eukprot:scaffold26536_cov45-Prasinocladus_malaysianus.AAC.1
MTPEGAEPVQVSRSKWRLSSFRNFNDDLGAFFLLVPSAADVALKYGDTRTSRSLRTSTSSAEKTLGFNPDTCCL